MKIVIILGVLLAPLLVVAPVVLAQETVRGQVTNLPVPRFVSMKSGAANVRRGPSTSNRIDWELKHRGTPLRVLAEYREWFRVEDAEGEGGWVHSALLSSLRTVLVQQDMLALRDGPSEGTAALAHLEAGVIARLATCQPDWCSVSVEGYKGWLPRSGIWGVAAEE